jgi:hypothetical protein
MREFSSLVNDLDLEEMAASAYQELGSQIEQTEGFPVEVRLDENQWWLSGDGRQLDNGCLVLFPSDYPYRRAMNGNKTIEHWITNRFGQNYPGLEVVMSTELPDNALLSDLRAEQLAT